MSTTNSMYIHFPFCLHLCNYCDFYKHKLTQKSDVDGLTQFIAEQLNFIKDFHDKNNSPIKELDTLYLGGGTPSLWSQRGINFFKEKLSSKQILLATECEFTLEVDPGTISKEDLRAWADLGVNRLSIGVQSYDEHFLKVMDRIHGIQEIRSLMEFAPSIISNFSFDLMIGLPFSLEKNRDVKKEIDELIKFNPSHFSVYILKTRANYPHNSEMPQDDYVEQEYLNTVSHLESYGYEQYEVSNFAKSGKRSKHNIQYWRSGSVASIGPNSTGLINKGSNAIRYQQKSSSVGVSLEDLDSSALKLEKLYMILRTTLGTNLHEYISEAEAQKLVGLWQKNNYLQSADVKKIILNSKGFLMLDSLMNDFFSHTAL